MDKSNYLQMAYKSCLLLKNEAIKEEIENYLFGYSLYNIKLQNSKFECDFLDKNSNKINLSLSPREINLYKQSDNILSCITINEDYILRQADVEKRENGLIYKEIKKHFAISSRFKNKMVLVDLIEDSYIFTEDTINKIIEKEDFHNVRLIYILLNKIWGLSVTIKNQVALNFTTSFYQKTKT